MQVDENSTLYFLLDTKTGLSVFEITFFEMLIKSICHYPQVWTVFKVTQTMSMSTMSFSVNFEEICEENFPMLRRKSSGWWFVKFCRKIFANDALSFGNIGPKCSLTYTSEACYLNSRPLNIYTGK